MDSMVDERVLFTGIERLPVYQSFPTESVLSPVAYLLPETSGAK